MRLLSPPATPNTGITDRNENLLVFGSLRLNDRLSYSFGLLHRFDAVDNEIHRDPLQLNAISDHLRQIGCAFRAYRYVVSHRLATQEGDAFSNVLVCVNKLSIRGRPSRIASASC
jgi:hypothetical protein